MKTHEAVKDMKPGQRIYRAEVRRREGDHKMVLSLVCANLVKHTVRGGWIRLRNTRTGREWNERATRDERLAITVLGALEDMVLYACFAVANPRSSKWSRRELMAILESVLAQRRQEIERTVV